MRIASARITNYRSVIDSTAFSVERDKTILVGINEAGKTALLKALQLINPPPETPPVDKLADYPRSALNDLLDRPADEAGKVNIVEVTFDLDDADRAVLPSDLKTTGDVGLDLFRQLDNSLAWRLVGVESAGTFKSLKADLTRLRAHVVKATDAHEALAQLDVVLRYRDDQEVENSAASELLDCLQTVLPFVDEDNQKELTRWETLSSAAKVDGIRRSAFAALHARVPLMVYYSTYFTVRPRIDLESLATRQERGDIDGEYDFGNLCLLKLLGFTARQLSDLAAAAPVKPPNYPDDHGARDAHDSAIQAHQRKLDERGYRLNGASLKLTEDIRRVWGDDGMTLRIVADGQYLKVMVVDDLGVEVELDQRSEGFRWLVSFFVVFRSQARDNLKGAILLLDEPGMSLHALKQQEFRKTVSLLGQDNQIIYTTHSPFMVGSDELDLVRIVEMADRKAGTKVHTRIQVEDPKSIFPLQAALGYELAQSMFSQKRNIVCEGVTDMFYINAINEASAADGGPTLKNDPAVISAGTASKVAYFCVIYASQNLSVAALLDSDNEGDSAASQDNLVALLPKKAILRAADFIDPTYKAAETEDLFRTTLGLIAKDLGFDSTVTLSTQPTRPIMDIFDKDHGKNAVSKWKLSKGFSNWLHANGYSALPTAEKAAWTRLCAALNKAL